MKNILKFIKSLEIGVLIALTAIAFVAFANALDNPFLIDDHAFFDEKLKNPKYVWLHFLPDKNKVLKIEGESTDPFFRPLATIIPMLMHLAFRGDVIGYHASNTVLFTVAGWMLFLFVLFLGGSRRMAFLAALFYIVHPINGVVVNYITASVFAVQMVLMLGSLMCLMLVVSSQRSAVSGQLTVDGQRPTADIHPLTANGLLLTMMSLVLYLLATFCHETAMALPFYALVLVAVFRPVHDGNIFSLENLKSALIKILPLFLVMGAYFVFRMSHSSLEASILDKIARYDMNFAQYLSTWTMLLWWYISRLFYPEGIVLIMAHQPLKETGPIIGWIAALGATVGLGAAILWNYRRDRFAFFGFALFVLGFGPYTLACFFQPIHGLMIEPHWFLFPVMGFFIFLARIVERLVFDTSDPKAVIASPPRGRSNLMRVYDCFVVRQRSWRTPRNDEGGVSCVRGVVAMLFLILVPWLVMGWRHNHIWGDEVRYCQWWLAKSPSFVAVNAYIAKAYELRKEFDKARAHYSTVLGRKYKAYIAYTNMGLMDLQEEKWESAKSNFQHALDLDPNASVAVSNMGIFSFKDGKFEEALGYFKRCRELDRFAILPRLNISKTYLKLGDPKAAADELEEALKIVPYHEIALVNLIKIYIDQNDRSNVEKVARWILERSQNPNALNNVSIIFKSYGKDTLSREAAARAKKFSGQ